jgi:hypothetical protein
MDPEYGRHSADSDGWDDALGYMDACGPGWHLQIARTTSDDGLANGSLISHASGLSTCLLGESHPRSVRARPFLPFAILLSEMLLILCCCPSSPSRCSLSLHGMMHACMQTCGIALPAANMLCQYLANLCTRAQRKTAHTCALWDSVQHQTLNAPGDGSAMGEATKGIVQKARMAADLYQQQAAIESRVKQRCAPPAALSP